MFSNKIGGDCRLPAPARNWALPSLAILLLAISLAWDAWSGYRRSLDEEFRLLDAHARIADAHLSGALRLIEATLREVASNRLATSSFDPLLQSGHLAAQKHRIPEVQEFFLTDAAGRIEAMSNPAYIGTDASRREYFTRARNSTVTDKIFISRPYTTQSGIVVMAVSYALHGAQGRFHGVAVASIKPAFFESLLMAVHPDGAGFAFLANSQGDILHAAKRREWVGRNIEGGPAFTAHMASGERMTHHLDRTKHEPITRLSVVRTLENRELLFFVGRDLDEALAPWKRNTIGRLLVFLAATLALLYLGWRATQHQRSLLAVQAGLRESEVHLRKAQQIAHVGSWTFDPENGRLSGTDETCRIYGITPGEPIDIGLIQARIHPEERATVEQAWQAALAGMPFDIEYRLCPEGEQTRWIRMMAEPEYAPDGRIQSLIGVSRDISERKRAEQASHEWQVHLEQRVRERTIELENSNRELESFSYSVSHDLRTPLRAIDGFSHILAEDYRTALDEDGHNLLQRIRRATQKMGTLIDNLLDLAQVSRQKLRFEPIDLSRLADELAHEISEAHPEHPVDWAIQAGMTSQGDAFLLKVALNNLLLNAWKFSSRTANPRIEFGSRIDNGRVEYYVRDNGIGLDMSYAGKLFQPFQRLHDAKEYEGTGIGLATVHRVIRRHGGSIRIESSPGQGATFFFTLAP